MKRHIVAACLTLAASAAMSATVAHNGSDWVMLTEAPCPAVVAEKVDPKYRDQLQEAKTVIGGKPFVACWLLEEARWAVHLVYEDGEEGLISVLMFHDEPGV